MITFLSIICVLAALWWLSGVVCYLGYRNNFRVHLAFGNMYHHAALRSIGKSARRAFLLALITGGLLIYLW